MSFILDALKKSETERQQQGGAEFSSVPVSSDTPRPLRWLWLLGLLLAVNLAVLVGILMRPDTPPTPLPRNVAPPADPTSSAIAPAVTEPADSRTTFAERVAAVRETQPVAEDTPAAASAPAATRAEPRPVSRTSRIPTIDELLLDGSLQLPQLHVDIHVYSDVPAERFVFINMVKHREQSRLAEGPVVTEITTDGVVLEHQGQTFLLPRE